MATASGTKAGAKRLKATRNGSRRPLRARLSAAAASPAAAGKARFSAPNVSASRAPSLVSPSAPASHACAS